MVDTVYCTIHVRSMQAKCIMILYVTLNQDNELGPTRILRIYNHVLYTLCTVHITGMYVRRIMFFVGTRQVALLKPRQTCYFFMRIFSLFF